MTTAEKLRKKGYKISYSSSVNGEGKNEIEWAVYTNNGNCVGAGPKITEIYNKH